MKERPILFSAPMVRAILAGTKTQTRRICKGARELSRAADWPLDTCPYGAPGGRLWVRETWCKVHDAQFGADDWIDYRATPKYSDIAPAGWHEDMKDPNRLRWRPSIHMPRWASRITLEITDVRVERLQDISVSDAIAEGVHRGNGDLCGELFCRAPGEGYWKRDPRDAYADLWQSINGPGSWSANPWVWVISFRRTKP